MLEVTVLQLILFLLHLWEIIIKMVVFTACVELNSSNLLCACLIGASASEVDETDRKTGKEMYSCPAWMNFRLDIDAVMHAMFPV